MVNLAKLKLKIIDTQKYFKNPSSMRASSIKRSSEFTQYNNRITVLVFPSITDPSTILKSLRN